MKLMLSLQAQKTVGVLIYRDGAAGMRCRFESGPGDSDPG
jgi:hypothetical protein